MTTKPLTDAEIAELERLEREATPGPWVDDYRRVAAEAPDRHSPRPWIADIPQGGARWREDQNCALIAAARNALPSLLAEVRASRAGGPAPDANAPEARLAAFVKRYSAERVEVHYDVAAPPTEDPWRMWWYRRYPDGVLSDGREVEASTFGGIVSAAEEWEDENDALDPQHAAGPRSEAGREPPCDDHRANGPDPHPGCRCAEIDRLCSQPNKPAGRSTSGTDVVCLRHGADPRIKAMGPAPLDEEIDLLRVAAANLAKKSNEPDVPFREVLRHNLRQIEERIDALLMERIARMP